MNGTGGIGTLRFILIDITGGTVGRAWWCVTGWIWELWGGTCWLIPVKLTVGAIIIHVTITIKQNIYNKYYQNTYVNNLLKAILLVKNEYIS